MLKEEIFLACLLGFAAAAPEEWQLEQMYSRVAKNRALNIDTLTPKQHPPSVDDIADVFINEIRKLAPEFIPLPDATKQFDGATLYVKQGRAWGIRNIQRVGHVMVDYTNRIITLSAAIKFPRILIDFDCTAQILLWTPEGHIIAEAMDTRISFSLSFDLNYSRITLNSFHVSKIGHLDATFQPDGWINFFVSTFTEDLLLFVETSVLNTIEKFAYNALNHLISIVNNKLAEIKPPPPDIA